MKIHSGKSRFLFLIATVSLVLLVLVGCSSPAATTKAPAPASSAPANTTAPAPVSSAAASQPATKQIVMSIAGTLADTDVKSIAVHQFADEITQKTNGAVKVNAFTNGQLIADKDMVTAMPAGMADFAQCQLGSFSGLVPEAAILDLCMVFASDNQWWAVAHGKVGDIITQKLQTKGNIKFLSWLGNLPTSCWSSTTKTIKTPADLQGVKFRTPPSAFYVKAMNTLGAASTIISVNEVYAALQTGTVSATFSATNSVIANKWYEVAPYISKMLFAPESSFAIVTNLDSWNKIPANYQQIIQQAANNQETYMRTASAKASQGYWDNIVELKAAGKVKDLYEIPDNVVQQFADIVMPSQVAEIDKMPGVTPGIMDIVKNTPK